MARKETLLREENIETLKLYMSGKSESAVGKAMGISRGGAKDRLQGYRDAGILEGSFNRGGTPSCHWDSLNALREEEGLSPIEEITPPDRNVKIGVSRPKPTTPEPISAPISVPTPVSTPAQFTDAEVTLLKNLVRETQEKAEEPPNRLIENSGNKTGRNFRIEDNLFAEIQIRAKKENIPATAILERALREYLEVDYL